MKSLKKPLALIALAFLLFFNCSKNDKTQLSHAKFSIDQSSINFSKVEIEAIKNVLVTVTNNIALKYLYSFQNQLTSLNLANNSNLAVMEAYENGLTCIPIDSGFTPPSVLG